MVNKLMNIGCLGQGSIFSNFLGVKVPSPVDNMQGYNFKSVINLFNGSLFDAMVNDKIDHKQYREWENCQLSDDDNVLRYYCTMPDVEWSENYSFPNIRGHYNWRTIHTNFEDPIRKSALKDRIDIFNRFNKEIDDSSWYVYTIADEDKNLTKEEFYYVIDNLPSYVLKNLLVVTSMRNEIPELFLNEFKCIFFNYNMLTDKLKWNRYE